MKKAMEKTTIGQVGETSKDITINHIMIVGMYTLDKVDFKVTCYTLAYRSQKTFGTNSHYISWIRMTSIDAHSQWQQNS